MSKVTVISLSKEYKGFEFVSDGHYYTIHEKGSRKGLWCESTIEGCRKWVDELLRWMGN